MAIFIVINWQYRKMASNSHAEALKLKDDFASDLKVRIQELTTERNNYKEQSHINGNAAHAAGLELTKMRSMPNVTDLAEVIKLMHGEFRTFQEQQSKINGAILDALQSITKPT